MSKQNGVVFWGRTLIIIAVGICISIAVFLFSDYTVKGSHTVWSIITAILSGFLVSHISLTVINYLSSKRSGEQADLNDKSSSTDKTGDNFNRSFLDQFLTNEIEAAKNEEKPVSVIMADLDHFKDISSMYGNIVGDHILSIFTMVVLRCMRPTDFIARYGEDQIILVLPDTDVEAARKIAEHIREEVSKTYIPPVDGVVISSIYCSTGVSAYPTLSDDKNTLIRTSDLALRLAKQSGRNCTKVYKQEIPAG
ncbi:MAG TPA: GGDEF domain-containing protein [Clostridia bacterium]|nr:GGDEF domain-containing protein [Clostridia bacterium]